MYICLIFSHEFSMCPWAPAPDSDNAKVFPKASIFNALNASDELLGGEVPVKGCTWRSDLGSIVGK